MCRIHRTPWLVAHRWVVWVVNLLGLYITHLAVGDFFLFSYFPWTLGEVHPVCGVFFFFFLMSILAYTFQYGEARMRGCVIKKKKKK